MFHLDFLEQQECQDKNKQSLANTFNEDFKYKLCQWQISQLENLHDSILRHIEAKDLSVGGVRHYYAHIPVREYCGEWSEEVYKTSDKLLQSLYEYSKQMDFIDNNASFDDFIEFFQGSAWNKHIH